MGAFKKKIKKKIQNGQERIVSNPKFPGISALFMRSKEAQLTVLASSISYYLLLAIFPFILLFSSILSVSGILGQIDTEMILSLQEILPLPVFEFLYGFIHDNLGSSIPVLSVSSIMALWAASKGMGVLLRGLRRLYDKNPKTLPFVWRALGLLFTIVLCFAILLSLALVTFGDVFMQQLRQWTNIDFFTGKWITFGRFLGAFLFLFLFFSILYWITGLKKITFRKCFPGAALAALSWLLFSFLFSWYISNVSMGRFSLFYGSVAGMIILIFWLYFCCFSLLCGGLFNVLLEENRKGLFFPTVVSKDEKKKEI